jgi:hypothetical protein
MRRRTSRLPYGVERERAAIERQVAEDGCFGADMADVLGRSGPTASRNLAQKATIAGFPSWTG